MIDAIDLIGKSKKSVDAIGQIIQQEEKTSVFAGYGFKKTKRNKYNDVSKQIYK